ncbi:NlpC/P60-like cell-wall peptidase [Metarhizium album ARSEF 1941]|uniref:NlpC/P60-like cell-wall peptidase n=1 Tax=Metarhizium album (strain ARSEF 1941) TaxID=1081103 RepID=A0A0B2WYS1_METAS|nr:NlpC/P60-like cell-wall peptidase [Metarhizium album ARSEF 1941]KHO01427.1 NlpC/P60-like cell-wall peptidase [Metarhizium album ARSEF 1941]
MPCSGGSHWVNSASFWSETRDPRAILPGLDVPTDFLGKLVKTPPQTREAGFDKRTGPGIVAAAEKMKGKPYVWGGGDIHGPTKGGFDCSGLTQYAVYQAQKRKIPRTAQTQYTSKLGRHIPRGQAQAGDLLFWGKGGNCETGVVHVGIFTRPGWMVNAAHTGVPVRDQKIWTSSGGESICPDAVRFW